MSRTSIVVALALTVATPAMAGEIVWLGSSQATVRRRHKGHDPRLHFYFKHGGTPAAIAYLRALPKGGKLVRDATGKLVPSGDTVTKMPQGDLRLARVAIDDPNLRMRLSHVLIPPTQRAHQSERGVLAFIKPEGIDLGRVRPVSGIQEVAFSATGYRTGGRQHALATVKLDPAGKIEILDVRLGWLDAAK